MPVLLFDGNIAKLQSLEEASWPEGSIKEHSIRSQTSSGVAVASHSVDHRGRHRRESYRRSTSAMLASVKVEQSKVDIQYYRTLPKVTNFRTFGRIPAWGRKPQKMTYHLCAENITKNCIVPNLPDDEKDDLLTRRILPPSSSARDMHCVMCPVRRGSPRLLPCCLCYNWCHPGCSYQTHLGTCVSMSRADLRSQAEDYGVEISLS